MHRRFAIRARADEKYNAVLRAYGAMAKQQGVFVKDDVGKAVRIDQGRVFVDGVERSVKGWDSDTPPTLQGDITEVDGRVRRRVVVCTTANDRFVTLRNPESADYEHLQSTLYLSQALKTLCGSNRYTTTIHAINSCVIKVRSCRSSMQPPSRPLPLDWAAVLLPSPCPTSRLWCHLISHPRRCCACELSRCSAALKVD